MHTIFKIEFIERKFRENEVKNYVKSTSKFAKILNRNDRFSFFHFLEFRLTKISLETLTGLLEITLSISSRKNAKT